MKDQKDGFWFMRLTTDISTGIAILVLLCGIGQSLGAQGSVSINNDGAPPDSSAILDLQSSSMGLLVPRMSTGERSAIGSPATGLIVYDLNESSLYCYSGSSWIKVMSGTTGNDNTASGGVALRSNTTGSRNSASGTGSLNSNTTGSENSVVGAVALGLNTVRSNLVAVGDSALYHNGTG